MTTQPAMGREASLPAPLTGSGADILGSQADAEKWSPDSPTRSGLYRTRVHVGGAALEEDLVAVALVYDGHLAFSRLMLEPSAGEREWLGPLTFRDLKTPHPA